MRFLFAIILLLTAGIARADLILLLSDERASVVGVAKAIQATYPEKIEIYNLKGDRSKENEIMQGVLDSNKRQVVAVGLLAAQLAHQWLPSKQVVFCQVLNFEEYHLVTPWMKGVSGIPSLTRQFATWKLLEPGLRRIGVITGRYAQYMLAEATTAAKRNGLELEHIEVPSDRAVLSAVQQLREKKVQGLWLAPDSSILSQRAIIDLMSYSVKNNLQVLAFSPSLLNEGALLSATADFDEIAHQVLDRLKRTSGSSTIPGEAVEPLGTARIVVSASVASRFGLSVSVKLREQADVQ